MIFIGERINAGFKDIKAAITNQLRCSRIGMPRILPMLKEPLTMVPPFRSSLMDG